MKEDDICKDLYTFFMNHKYKSIFFEDISRAFSDTYRITDIISALNSLEEQGIIRRGINMYIYVLCQ